VTTPNKKHYILLPGLHGTQDLYPPLINEIKKLSSNELLPPTFQSVNYPTTITQNYPKLLEWLAQETGIANSSRHIIIIAESFSCPLALSLAARYPTKIKATIIAAGFCTSPVNKLLSSIPSWLVRLPFLFSPPRALLRYLLLDHSTSNHELKELKTLLRRIPSSIISERLESVLTLRPATHFIQSPLLLLQATRDAIINENTQLAISQAYPKATVQWIDSPHLVLQTKPESSAKSIIEFLANIN